MMDCKDCIHYDDSDCYEGTGYCTVFYEYVSAYGSCYDYEEVDNER